MQCRNNISELLSITCLRGAAPVRGRCARRLQGLACHGVARGHRQLKLVCGLIVVLEVIFNVIVPIREIILWSDIAGGVAPIVIQKKKTIASGYALTNMMMLTTEIAVPHSGSLKCRCCLPLT